MKRVNMDNLIQPAANGGNMKPFILLILIFLSAAIAFAAAGDLDPTFSTDGLLLDSISGFGDNHTARTVAIQPNNKILIGGSVGQYLALARYNTDGSPDSFFGAAGKVTTIVDDDFEIQAIAVQTDGKIVAVACKPDPAPFNYFTVLRYNPDGSLETAWADTMGDDSNLSVAIAIQPDGGVLVAGSLGHQRSVLIRYRSSGGRDSTFGIGGKVITTIDRGNWATSIIVQPDGKIVTAGSSLDLANVPRFALVRYIKDGSLDRTFGLNGVVRTLFNSATAKAVALQADGSIVAAGRNFSPLRAEFALARYKSNGNLDPTFDSDGKVTTSLLPNGSEVNSVAVQSDGKILAAGNSTTYDDNDFYLVRYNANGSLDTTFGGGDGIAQADFEQGSNDVSYGMALDNSGKAVVAGISYQGGWLNSRFAIARFILGPRPGQSGDDW
jgi:uncharacterized delta-60 repeat protein